MNDATRRALRTFVQTFVGTIITSGILSTASETGVVDWSGLKKVGISALAAGIVALLTFVQNFLEDTTTVPAILKAPASEGVNPVPDAEGGYVSPGWVTAAASVGMLIVLVLWAHENGWWLS